MRFSLREAMWWFAIAATMAAAVFSTPSPPSPFTSFLLFGAPLVVIWVYLWVSSDAFGRRWMALVAVAATVAAGIAIFRRGSDVFVPFISRKKGASGPMVDFVSSEVGAVAMVVGMALLLSAITGTAFLFNRRPAGPILFLLLCAWAIAWNYEVMQANAVPVR
jgi:hypothetical protein